MDTKRSVSKLQRDTCRNFLEEVAQTYSQEFGQICTNLGLVNDEGYAKFDIFQLEDDKAKELVDFVEQKMKLINENRSAKDRSMIQGAEAGGHGGHGGFSNSDYNLEDLRSADDERGEVKAPSPKKTYKEIKWTPNLVQLPIVNSKCPLQKKRNDPAFKKLWNDGDCEFTQYKDGGKRYRSKKLLGKLNYTSAEAFVKDLENHEDDDWMEKDDDDIHNDPKFAPYRKHVKKLSQGQLGGGGGARGKSYINLLVHINR